MNCSPIITAQSTECDSPQATVKKIEVRKNKRGNLQVRVNGKGKWIPCEFDPIKKTIQYYA